LVRHLRRERISSRVHFAEMYLDGPIKDAL
jgi:hypothetical protein